MGSPPTLNPGWGAPESLTGGAGAGAPTETAAFFGAGGEGFLDVLKKAKGPGFRPGDPWLSSSKTSRRKTNITRFPFATGQRGGSKDTALRTRWVWKGGWKSTQSSRPSASRVAERTLAIR